MKTTTTTITGLLAIGLLAGLARRADAIPPQCSWESGGTASCCWQDHYDDLGTPQDAWVIQAPSVVSMDGGATLWVFAQGWDNSIWTRHSSGTTWTAWESLGNNAMTSRPSAVAVGPNRMYVFARGNDHALWYRQYNAGSWGAWTYVGGWLMNGPSAAAWADGSVEVEVVGGDSALYSMQLTGTTATPWKRLDGVCSGEPIVTHRVSGSTQTMEAWVMGGDGQLWRRVHTRKPVGVGRFAGTMDSWGPWEARASGTYGAPGFYGAGVVAELLHNWMIYVRVSTGEVWSRTTGVIDGLDDVSYFPEPITASTDVSVAPDNSDIMPHVVYVDRDTGRVTDYSSDYSCSTCGDGRCFGYEDCSHCPADCGACAPACGNHVCNGSETCKSCPWDCGACPAPPPSSCQDYQFCLVAPGVPGTPVTGHGCSLGEARDDAYSHSWGAISDGPCKPAWCGGTPYAVEWCCHDTGTTYFGAACTKSEADAAAHVDIGCSSWTEGYCD